MTTMNVIGLARKCRERIKDIENTGKEIVAALSPVVEVLDTLVKEIFGKNAKVELYFDDPRRGQYGPMSPFCSPVDLGAYAEAEQVDPDSSIGDVVKKLVGNRPKPNPDAIVFCPVIEMRIGEKKIKPLSAFLGSTDVLWGQSISSKDEIDIEEIFSTVERKLIHEICMDEAMERSNDFGTGVEADVDPMREGPQIVLRGLMGDEDAMKKIETFLKRIRGFTSDGGDEKWRKSLEPDDGDEQ